MKRRYIKFVMMLALAVGVTVAFWGVASASQSGGDHTEANDCASCHYGAGGVVMPAVVAQWEGSAHGNSYSESNGNTYCASCHSQGLADPDASYGNNDPVPQEDWQDVTCSSCHPPHDLRVEWGTPIGTYDVDTSEWSPVQVEDSNELCTSCHAGTRHGKDFKGFGQSMFDKKGVDCVDCHMPEVPLEGASDGVIRSHTWTVWDNLPQSCGLESGCHSNHSEKWAEKQIAKEKIHGSGGKNPDK